MVQFQKTSTSKTKTHELLSRPTTLQKRNLQGVHFWSWGATSRSWDMPKSLQNKTAADVSICIITLHDSMIKENYSKWLLLLCRECDSRPEDPRYQVTEGDVLIYTEPPRFEHTANIEPKPTRPPFLRLPAPVICKMVSDSVSCLDCYCACVAVPREPCETNL